MPALAKESQKAVCEHGRSVLYQNVPSLGERSAMAASLVSPDGSLGMVYVESSSTRASKFSVPDLDILMFAAMQMASGLDQVLRDQTDMIARKIGQNQEMSRKVQQRIAPWKLPQWPGLAVGVFSESGKNECTDFYDIVPNGQEQGMVLIGRTGSDETDSALTMAEIGSAFRIGAVHRVQPQVMLRLANWVIYGYRNEPRRISAGVLAIDPDSGEFLVSLVGEIHGWVIGDSGKVTKIGRHTDVWIGQARKSKFEGVTGKLKTRESLVLFTEGIFKLRAPDGRTFSRDQFEEYLSDSSAQPLSGVMSDLVSEIKNFTGGEAFASDMTVVMLRKL
jgi:serine phosphatase RsbU (regulator of sigma subunit)